MNIDEFSTRFIVALERIATALEGGDAPAATAAATGKRGPGRPRKTETIEGAPAGESPAPAAAPAETAPTPSPAASTAQPAAAAAPATPPAAAPAQTAAAPASGEIPDVAVQKTVTALVQANKRDWALAALKAAGGESASKVPQGNRRAFLKEAKAQLGTLPAEAAGYAP